MGTAPYPFNTVYGVQVQNIPVEIDEEILTQIAEKTGGKYFRATNNEKLRMIYNEIDQLEKTKDRCKGVYSKNRRVSEVCSVRINCYCSLELLIDDIHILRQIP
ncbi:MAG: hypothetical protein MZV63_44850 [Marinilabiliales bacterium]|nr:hypothetical protein [Marinilabiliales bacterium]